MVKLKGPKDAALVVFDGTEYRVKNGTVEVPDEAVEMLARQGWHVAKQDKAEK